MERTEPPKVGAERDVLLGFLDFQRDTLAWKCEGLTDTQLSHAAVEPSPLSLLGLVRHLADVERDWFRRGIAGEQAPPRYEHDDDLDADFTEARADTRENAFAVWRQEIARAREIIAEHELDETVTHPRTGYRHTVRWILLHMVEEYSRHNGHADLLRERIDGATGR